MSVAVHHWDSLTEAERKELLERPALRADDGLWDSVREIVERVRTEGDAAVAELTQRHDGAVLDTIRVSDAEMATAEQELPGTAIAAIEVAIANVRRFHEVQLPDTYSLEVVPGVRCERHWHPIDSVGLYVPAGTAPLPSTAIMLAVPASIAGCPRRVLCTPPRPDGRADPGVLAAARRAGVTEVYKFGGAQAIAAMAYGTESLDRVDKIFGPGNAWVTAAKLLVASDMNAAAIDMPAGPSEVLVIADSNANPVFVATDLLSQAEHGVDSQVVLLTTDAPQAARVLAEIETRPPGLKRKSIVGAALAHCRVIVVRDLDAAVAISNVYAPEHLIVQTANPRALLPGIRNAGSVFLGPWSPEAAGDYCSGTNHVLPTSGQARNRSGLSVDDFVRHMTVQELSREGLRSISGAIVELANLEGLGAHADAVRCRVDGNPEQTR